jgi:phage host-nuclease inhibitor protein Gam
MNNAPTMKTKDKSRIKIPVVCPATRAEAEYCMTELASLANARRGRLAALDAKILALQKETAPFVADCDATIAARTDQLRAWAQANPGEFAAGRKSIELLSGVLGFRTGNPRLALLSRAWSWEKVLEALKTNPLLAQFVRTKEEVDKDRLLRQANGGGGFDSGAFGVKVIQDETFFVEPRLTNADICGNANEFPKIKAIQGDSR